MKICTANFNLKGIKFSLAMAMLIACIFFSVSCERDQPLQNLDPCGPDGPPTVFINQTGYMFYVAEVDQWAIGFLPDCLAIGNFDTSYMAFLGTFPLNDEFKVQKKAVLFNGEIKPSTIDPSKLSFPAGVESYDLNLTYIEIKKN